MSNLSIRIKLLAIVIVTIVLVSIIIATKSIYEVNNLTNQTIEEYKQRAFSSSIEEMKNYTTFAVNIAKDAYEKSKIENVKAIYVFDMSGRLIKRLAPSTELNLSNLSQQSYLLVLVMENGYRKPFKIIKK